MRNLTFLLLLIAVTGCRKNPFPSQIQPAEFDVYHSYLLGYAKAHPEDEQQIYIGHTVSASSFLPADGADPNLRKTYEQCLSPKAYAAFRTLHADPDGTGSASSDAWRTLTDGKVVPLVSTPRDPKIPTTTISFSRVFFEASGKEAYLNTGVSKCNGACGGRSMLWHAVHEGDAWTFSPTRCYGLE